MVIVGTVQEDGGESIIAIGSYSRIPNTDLAEVALVVRDDWQNKGLGTILFNYLCEIAKRRGLAGFAAWVMMDNDRMMHIFKKSKYPVRYRIEGNLYYVEIMFK